MDKLQWIACIKWRIAYPVTYGYAVQSNHPACPSKLEERSRELIEGWHNIPERWLSGLKRLPAKQESGSIRARGFESLSLHQSSLSFEDLQEKLEATPGYASFFNGITKSEDCPAKFNTSWGFTSLARAKHGLDK